MNRNKQVLRSKKLFVLDMDGTFYLGDTLLEGSLQFIDKLKNAGKEFLFFTNNSSRISEYYKNKLSKMGCEVEQDRIVTSGDVTISYLLDNYPSKKIFLVGTKLLEKSFKDAGLKLVQDNPDIVVVGFDTTLTYEKVSKACKYIREGALFIATHLDLNCPTEDGFIPDCGSMCAMITASTGVKPKYLGKPFKETLDAIIKKTGCNKEEIAFIGDRLYTDIAIGVNNGVTSVLVLSGETKEDDLKKSEVKPDFVFPALKYITEAL